MRSLAEREHPLAVRVGERLAQRRVGSGLLVHRGRDHAACGGSAGSRLRCTRRRPLGAAPRRRARRGRGQCCDEVARARPVAPLQAAAGRQRHALVRERRLRHAPAEVLLADEVLGGHAHVGEEHLVEAGASPVMLRIGRTSMPGRSIGMMKYEMPRCFDTSLRVRAIRMPNLACVGERRPDLLAVHDGRRRRRARRACARFARSEPAPGSLNSWHHSSSPREHRPEVALLLLVAAERDEDRAAVADADRVHRLRRRPARRISSSMISCSAGSASSPYGRGQCGTT